MSSLLFAEIAATCNALGYNDGNKYYIDIHCVETIKDLIRYLRRDDEHHTIRRHLGETKVLQTDLIPILKQYWEKTEIFDVVLRLLVNLTNPALLLYREELPSDKTARNYYLQIISQLQSYKETFTDEVIWAVISKKLGTVLQIEWNERSEDTGLIIERMLILARNVLQVPADPEAERRTDNDASIHDQILWALNNSGIVDIFLYIASTDNEQQYYMHVLENISLMLREQKPVEIANAAPQRSVVEKERDEGELVAIRMQEKIDKEHKVKKFTGARHSRFGGTFVIRDMKSISDQDLIYHKPLNNLSSLNFDREKTKQKPPKNRRPMKGDQLERRSAFGIRLFLKKFCVEFLLGAYNTFMYHVKDSLARARTQANDESYYLWAMKFFMEFNRNYKFHIKYVSETMSIQTFHFVQTQLDNCREMMVTDKKRTLLWSRRMHLALKAYQELLLTLMAMDKSEEENIRSSAKVLKSNLFYVIEYRELILGLLNTFNEIKQSRAYLKDLIETAHVFLKMLEQYCSSQHLTVQHPVHARKGRKKKKSQPEVNNEPAVNLEELWDELAPEVSVVLQGALEIPNTVVPFDVTLDRTIDDQKVDAMRRIQTLIKEQKFEDAVCLFRASREVWPEDDIFGSALIAPEDELLILREIVISNLPSDDTAQPHTEQEEDEENEESGEDEETEGMGTAMSEQDFKFIDFERRLVNSQIIQACCILLRQFEKNTPYTNHCIVKILHRIAWDCKMPAMLFQASLFHTFQQILDSKNPQHKELTKFAIFIICKFAEVAAINSKVYMELLFWKTHRDAFEIEEGYGSYKTQTKSGKLTWAEEEEDELRRLYEEYMSKDGPSSGVVDFIMDNIINKDRSRRGVQKKLKEMGFYVDTKRPSSRPPRQWQEDEEQQLRELFDMYRESEDPLGFILTSLTIPRSRNQIVNKLLELGVIQDRKEVRKKRSRKSRITAGASGSESECSASDDDSGDEQENLANGSDSASPSVSTLHKPTKVPRPHKNQPAPQRGKHGTPTQKKKNSKRQTILFSMAEVAKLLEEVIAQDKRDALQWIIESLEEEATDRETEQPEEGIPLLPLNEECMTAMEDSTFLTLLEAIGIAKPQDEQEMYWRIPPMLNTHELRTRARVISQALNGQLSSAADNQMMVDLTEQESTAERGEIQDAASSSEDEFETLRKYLKKGNEEEEETPDTVSSSVSSNNPHTTVNKVKRASTKTPSTPSDLVAQDRKTVKKRLSKNDFFQSSRDNSSDSETDNVNTFNNEGSVQSSHVKDNSDSDMIDLKQIRNQVNKILDSDDDDRHHADPLTEISKTKKIYNQKKTIFDSDSDDNQVSETRTAEVKAHKRILDSDSDDSREVQQNSSDQKKRIIKLNSDSDDYQEVERNATNQKKRIINLDSDSDDSREVEQNITSQRKRIINSDSDDDNLPVFKKQHSSESP